MLDETVMTWWVQIWRTDFAVVPAVWSYTHTLVIREQAGCGVTDAINAGAAILAWPVDKENKSIWITCLILHVVSMLWVRETVMRLKFLTFRMCRGLSYSRRRSNHRSIRTRLKHKNAQRMSKLDQSKMLTIQLQEKENISGAVSNTRLKVACE